MADLKKGLSWTDREEAKAIAVERDWQKHTIKEMSASGPICWEHQKGLLYAQVYHEYIGSRPKFVTYSSIVMPRGDAARKFLPRTT